MGAQFVFLPRAFFGPQTYLCLPCSLSDRYMPPPLVHLLKWGLANFLPRQAPNHSLFPSSWDQRGQPLNLVLEVRGSLSPLGLTFFFFFKLYCFSQFICKKEHQKELLMKYSIDHRLEKGPKIHIQFEPESL
jgi:hypothetical protein